MLVQPFINQVQEELGCFDFFANNPERTNCFFFIGNATQGRYAVFGLFELRYSYSDGHRWGGIVSPHTVSEAQNNHSSLPDGLIPVFFQQTTILCLLFVFILMGHHLYLLLACLMLILILAPVPLQKPNTRFKYSFH